MEVLEVARLMPHRSRSSKRAFFLKKTEPSLPKAVPYPLLHQLNAVWIAFKGPGLEVMVRVQLLATTKQDPNSQKPY